MATTPTNKPIPSEDPRDLKFNAGKIDEVVNSDAHYYTDRFGVRRFTIAGFQYTAEEAIRNYGYITMDSFEDGATLTLPNQTLRYEANGEYYRWDGDFPKTVPAGSTPETSGGVGLGAWLSVGDATLRSEMVASINPVDNLSALNSSLASKKITTLTEAVTTADVIIVPSYSELRGIGHNIGVIGHQQKPQKVISKSGNKKYDFVNTNKPLQSRDAILAIDPAWIDGVYPQHTTIDGVSLLGDPSSKNDVGLFIFQGGNFTIRNMQIANCLDGILSSGCWISRFENVSALGGSLAFNGGTSHVLIGCAAWATAENDGAFYFNDVTYSSMIGCTSDHSDAPANFFRDGVHMTMVNCGSEFATSPGGGVGSMIASAGTGNKITVLGYKGVPRAGQTDPLISISENSTMHIINWYSNEPDYPNSLDISVNGDGSTIIVEDSIFSGGRTLPVVQFRGSQPNSKVIVKSGGNEYVYTSPLGGGIVSSPERKYRGTTYTPKLLVNGANVAELTYSTAVGSAVKNGNQLTVNFNLVISAAPSSPAQGTITLDLFSTATGYVPEYESSGVLVVSDGVGFGGVACVVSPNETQVYLKSSVGVNMQLQHIKAGTQIRGAVTFKVKGSGWS